MGSAAELKNTNAELRFQIGNFKSKLESLKLRDSRNKDSLGKRAKTAFICNRNRYTASAIVKDTNL